MEPNLKIVVMLGGPSAEREVSLRTGRAVAEALRSVGHEVTEIDPNPGQWTLPADTDVVFLALHGAYGEDGQIQAELDVLGVPYTGCGSEASRVAFDKVASKQRFVEECVPTPPYQVLTAESEPGLKKEFCPPVVLKPVDQGSSVGLQFVDQESGFAEGLREALIYGDTILMEPRIVGREVTVGILDGKALPIVEICPKQGSYDYANKYTPGATEYHCPADFSDAMTSAIQKHALAAFEAVDGRDYGRVDLMIAAGDRPLVLEVNTLPGMTETSLLPKAAAAVGMNYAELCDEMTRLAMKRAPVTA